MTNSGTIDFCVHRTSRAWLPLAIVLAGLAANKAIADSESEEVSAHVLQAEIALQRQEYKKAASEYRKAAELSHDVEIAREATRVGFSYGFTEDALRSAKRWSKLDKESDEALLFLAQLQLRQGEIKASSRSLTRLLKRSGESPDEKLIAFIPFLSQEDPQDADKLMRQLARPLENVVIDRRGLPVGGDRLLLVGVPDDDVGVGTDRYGALPRIDVQNLGDVRRSHRDELVHGQAAGPDPLGPQHRHAILDPAGAVWDPGEIAYAHALLLGGEGAVVARHDLQPGKI